MKKLISLSLLTMLLILCLCSCGGEKGVVIINNLGVDLIHFDLENIDGGGTSLPAGIANGASDTAFMHIEDKVGYVRITCLDSEGNTYKFPQVYLHDGVELTLIDDEGYLYASHFYDDSDWEHEGVLIPADSPMKNGENPLPGEWINAENGNTLSFYDEEEFKLTNDNGIKKGMYIYDGEYITFYFEGMISRATFDGEYLYMENDEGSYYEKAAG